MTMDAQTPYTLQVVERATGAVIHTESFVSPYLANEARKKWDAKPDADKHRTRVISPDPWP